MNVVDMNSSRNPGIKLWKLSFKTLGYYNVIYTPNEKFDNSMLLKFELSKNLEIMNCLFHPLFHASLNYFAIPPVQALPHY